ncbi:GNAT family N-acetyltransferase [Aurantivibrio infirmus]
MTNRTFLEARVTIAKACTSDAHVAWEIRRKAILVGCKNVYPDEQLAIWIGSAMPATFTQFVDEGCYVAKIEGEIIGTVKLDYSNGRVDGLFVEPGFMAQGIGKKLMLHVDSIAQSIGLKKLWLESTINAAPFYRACGFVGDKIQAYPSRNKNLRIDCIPMQKILEA